MVVKLGDRVVAALDKFESSVIQDGSKTVLAQVSVVAPFESSVIQDGSKTEQRSELRR